MTARLTHPSFVWMLALLSMVAVTAGCSSAPPVHDVRFTYARKATDAVGPMCETYFNAEHSAFVSYRTASLRGSMPAPGRGAGTVELYSWPIGRLPAAMRFPDDVPEAYRDRIGYLSPEEAVPSGLPDDERRRMIREQPGLLTWVGTMSPTARDELLQVSDDPEWQRAILALGQEPPDEEEVTSGPAVIQEGYNVLLLPPDTFPADDEDMRTLPIAFERIGFFRYGRAARDEAHALQVFHGSGDSVREALVLTVDGVCTVWMTPQYHPSRMSADEYRREQEQFVIGLRIYLDVLRHRYRPSTVSADDRSDVFFREQDRLRRQREEDFRRLNEERARYGEAPVQR